MKTICIRLASVGKVLGLPPLLEDPCICRIQTSFDYQVHLCLGQTILNMGTSNDGLFDFGDPSNPMDDYVQSTYESGEASRERGLNLRRVDYTCILLKPLTEVDSLLCAITLLR